MATPKARKLPSGAWNVQVTIHGKRRSITKAKRKDAEAEAMYLLAASQTNRLSADEVASTQTVGFILDMYIERRKHLLSNVSVQDYNAIRRNRFKRYMNKTWASVDWQKAIDEELQTCKRSTVYTAWNVLKSAARYAGIDAGRINVRFPKAEDPDHAFFTVNEMHRFQDTIKGDRWELACLLGLLSLRKSEILGMKRKDVDIERQVLHVRGTTVYMSGDGPVYREETKTEGSRRDIPLYLNKRIADIVTAMDLKPDDFLVYGGINSLYNYINKKCDELELPRIGVHGLRHTFASVCWEKDIPIEVCMLYGGWRSETTVRRVYQHLSAARLKEHSEKLAEAFARP